MPQHAIGPREHNNYSYSIFNWFAHTIGLIFDSNVHQKIQCHKHLQGLRASTSFHLQTVRCRLSFLTTALLNGGWVPQTSTSVCYWQPAPRWDYSRGRQILTTQPCPHGQGKRGTCQTDIVYMYSVHCIEWKQGKVGEGNNTETMLVGRMVLQQTQGIHLYVNNRRLLTVLA